LRVAIIGYGAIGSFLVKQLASDPELEVTAVFAVPSPPADCKYSVASLDELLDTQPEIVVECAGHEALRMWGPKILCAGKDLLVASVGALADSEVEVSLRSAAKRGGKLIIPGGALGGIDSLSAAREAGLDFVEYCGRKAPLAWKGTYAESLIDITNVKSAITFLECDARTAALKFPQNANVVAAIALAGIGFEKTKVRLMIDPNVSENHHSYTAIGEFGELSTCVRSLTLPSNPKTSLLAPFSLIQTIKKSLGIVLA
jgi:aspartate dehydrogenase